VAIFAGNDLAAQITLKLDSRCSNNQEEQLAILKALEAIESINISENSPRTATIYTNSRITLDPLKNASIHSFLNEEIRKRFSILESSK
jgi:ribonuclease HI